MGQPRVPVTGRPVRRASVSVVSGEVGVCLIPPLFLTKTPLLSITGRAYTALIEMSSVVLGRTAGTVRAWADSCNVEPHRTVKAMTQPPAKTEERPMRKPPTTVWRRCRSSGSLPSGLPFGQHLEIGYPGLVVLGVLRFCALQKYPVRVSTS